MSRGQEVEPVMTEWYAPGQVPVRVGDYNASRLRNIDCMRHWDGKNWSDVWWNTWSARLVAASARRVASNQQSIQFRGRRMWVLVAKRLHPAENPLPGVVYIRDADRHGIVMSSLSECKGFESKDEAEKYCRRMPRLLAQHHQFEAVLP